MKARKPCRCCYGKHRGACCPGWLHITGESARRKYEHIELCEDCAAGARHESRPQRFIYDEQARRAHWRECERKRCPYGKTRAGLRAMWGRRLALAERLLAERPR